MPSNASSPTVIITGANGFVGGSLVKHFQAKGWLVRAWVHSPPAVRLAGVSYTAYDLGELAPATQLTGADYLVHAAHAPYETGRRSDELNLRGAQALVNACRQQEVKFVFLSSFSACDQADSHYGKVKLGIEALLDPARDLVLRPGLVLGSGGLFANMSAMVARRTLIPLVGGGRQPVHLIAVEDLCCVVEKGLIDDIRGIYMVAEPEPVTMRELLETVARRQQRNIRFFPVPIWLAYIGVRSGEFLGLRLPVNSDSVLGLRHLHRVDTRADLGVFGIQVRGFREMLATRD